MSDMDRAPLIRVQVDQEVFVDSVREGDQLEDATVATEVTSFDRVGDAYVLEGAIVFAGYANRSNQSPDSEASGASSSALDFSDGVIQHVHHRMPFFLRVPLTSQPRGLVNVASRISRWNLEVLEEGWVHVTADLNIVGLNGQHGYHFQCGAQEDGDVLFDSAVQDRVVESEEAAFTPGLEETEAESFASMMRSTDGSTEQDAANELRQSTDQGDWGAEVLRVTEDLSNARGGQVLDDGLPRETERKATDPRQEQDPNEATATEQLADFDRVFGGTDGALRNAETGPEQPVEETHGGFGSQDMSGNDRSQGEGNHEGNWAEFEFEHQINMADPRESTPNPPTSGEYFVPSRSFSVEGFHAASGFVPPTEADHRSTAPLVDDRETDMGTDATRRQHDFAPATGSADAFGDESGDDDADRGETVQTNESLWSFVDFNAPERAHTLRFVVVQEEESLELVAERIGCSRADLIRLNQLTQESVATGQMLMAPSQYKMIAR